MKRNLLLVALGLLLFAVIYFGAAWYIVGATLRAEAVPIEERPDAYGLAYEEVEFSPRDWPEITLRGWWIPAAEESRATVVRVHGVDMNRAELLGLTAALAVGGYSVLAFDLRGHGESDAAAMGAGLHEIDDVLGAVDYVIAERGAEEGKVFLHGMSFGAAISLMAGARDSRIGGIYSDSAFANLSDLVVQEVAGRTILPQWAAWSLRPGIIWVAQATRGLNVNEVVPEEAVGGYNYPLGLAHCRADERIVIGHLARIRIALDQPPRLTVYEDCAHGDAWPDYPDHYERVLLSYYDELLGVEFLPEFGG